MTKGGINIDDRKTGTNSVAWRKWGECKLEALLTAAMRDFSAVRQFSFPISIAIGIHTLPPQASAIEH